MRDSSAGIALLITSVALLVTGCSGSGNGSGNDDKKQPSLTVEEFRDEIVGESYSPKSKFFDKYDKPVRVQDVGDDTFLYYRCKDGTARAKCPQGPYQYDDEVAPVAVDSQ